MSKKSKHFFAQALLFLIIALGTLPYVALAQTDSFNSPVFGGSEETSANEVWICKPFTSDGSNDTLATCVRRIYNFALGISGLVAMGVLVYAGYMYMTAGGDGEQISHAKEMIGGVIAGIIILATAFILLQFLDPRLTRFDTIEQFDTTP